MATNTSTPDEKKRLLGMILAQLDEFSQRVSHEPHEPTRLQYQDVIKGYRKKITDFHAELGTLRRFFTRSNGPSNEQLDELQTQIKQDDHKYSKKSEAMREQIHNIKHKIALSRKQYEKDSARLRSSSDSASTTTSLRFLSPNSGPFYSPYGRIGPRNPPEIERSTEIPLPPVPRIGRGQGSNSFFNHNDISNVDFRSSNQPYPASAHGTSFQRHEPYPQAIQGFQSFPSQVAHPYGYPPVASAQGLHPTTSPLNPSVSVGIQGFSSNESYASNPFNPSG
ncbi:hypothetical protein BDZ97DRAFT_1926925 [Flammula alnicola]|nr:hypothetical protein BDZ97DRAFT_1926925 [Flammula alnicola]